jgi:Na+-transporting NADH:ubiquinone oxidoreductase subunit A
MDNASTDLLQAGINALSKLTDGKINLVLNGRSRQSPALLNISGVEFSYFSGPHPAGNPGVHIHHIDPINKGEVVWIINLQDVITIGRLLTDGIYKPERTVALTGSEVINPQYFKMPPGASIESIVRNNVKSGNLRFISGNVLTGTKISDKGFLGFYDSQVTVIPEGDYYEFLGWAAPGANKLSFSRTFTSKLFSGKTYHPDTNLHGGERAFVMTGQYEKVVPMDILPMQLFKAILAGNIDLMENLGIYEVAEEDFALCEFICPSKIEIQSIVREGLNLMKKEMS